MEAHRKRFSSVATLGGCVDLKCISMCGMLVCCISMCGLCKGCDGKPPFPVKVETCLNWTLF